VVALASTELCLHQNSGAPIRLTRDCLYDRKRDCIIKNYDVVDARATRPFPFPPPPRKEVSDTKLGLSCVSGDMFGVLGLAICEFFSIIIARHVTLHCNNWGLVIGKIFIRGRVKLALEQKLSSTCISNQELEVSSCRHSANHISSLSFDPTFNGGDKLSKLASLKWLTSLSSL
jgi:hypothetical protein